MLSEFNARSLAQILTSTSTWFRFLQAEKILNKMEEKEEEERETEIGKEYIIQ